MERGPDAGSLLRDLLVPLRPSSSAFCPLLPLSLSLRRLFSKNFFLEEKFREVLKELLMNGEWFFYGKSCRIFIDRLCTCGNLSGNKVEFLFGSTITPRRPFFIMYCPRKNLEIFLGRLFELVWVFVQYLASSFIAPLLTSRKIFIEFYYCYLLCIGHNCVIYGLKWFSTPNWEG